MLPLKHDPVNGTVRLDYCNSLYNGLAQTSTRKLQLAQNAAARLIAKISIRDPIKNVLRELHWLPVSKRCQYKRLVLTYKTLHGTTPAYICEISAQLCMKTVSNSAQLCMKTVSNSAQLCMKTVSNSAQLCRNSEQIVLLRHNDGTIVHKISENSLTFATIWHKIVSKSAQFCRKSE